MTKRIAIYTFVTGGYDAPSEPADLPEDFSWHCIIPTEEDFRKAGLSDNKQMSVFIKLHPEKFIPEGDYDYTLCMDANITVTDPEFYNIIRDLANKDTLYAGIKHPQRDDIFNESYKVISNGRDSLGNMIRVTRFLKSAGMPRHFGMMETNIIFRKNSDDRVKAFDSLWWEMYSKYPKRDQMTHSYCLWKTGMKTGYILPEGVNARNCHMLGYKMHGVDALKKDFSLSGRFRDAMRAMKKALFRAHLSIIGRPAEI